MLNKVVLPETVDEVEGTWIGKGTEVYRQLSKDAVKKIHYNVKMRISKMPEGQYRIESRYSFAKKTKIREVVYDKDDQSGDRYDYDAMIGDENNLNALTFYTDDDLSGKILERFSLSEQDANLLHHNYTGHARDSVFQRQRLPLPGFLSNVLNRFQPKNMLVSGNYWLHRVSKLDLY
jgi:hypothetical protein